MYYIKGTDVLKKRYSQWGDDIICHCAHASHASAIANLLNFSPIVQKAAELELAIPLAEAERRVLKAALEYEETKDAYEAGADWESMTGSKHNLFAAIRAYAALLTAAQAADEQRDDEHQPSVITPPEPRGLGRWRAGQG